MKQGIFFVFRLFSHAFLHIAQKKEGKISVFTVENPSPLCYDKQACFVPQ